MENDIKKDMPVIEAEEQEKGEQEQEVDEFRGMTDEEMILVVAKRILKKYSRAFKELAK